MLSSLVRIASISSIAISFLASSEFARADVTVGQFSDIQYWVGSGANQAAFVVDWNDATTTESYTWGYAWDGAATGEDMLRAIDSADTALTFNLQFFAGLGFSLSSASYDADGNGSVDHSRNDTVDAGYWSYWTQDTTSPFTSGTWTFAEVGMSARTLVNGSWDGWSWAAAPTFEEPGNDGPDAGVAAIPEPQTWALLVGTLGFAVLARGKNRKSV